MTNILLILQFTILYGTVLSLVAFGGMFSEHSGIINIALEGIMVIGAIAGAVVLALCQRAVDAATMSAGTVQFLTFMQANPGFIVILSILAAALAGGVYSLLLAFASINLKADQTIGGTALNLLAVALAIVIAKSINMSYLTNSANPQVRYVNSAFKIQILENPRFEISWFFIIALIALVAAYIGLYKTRFGLRLMSCGEHPQAADSVGINVYKFRYIGVLISGILGGIGGLAYVVPSVSTWNFEQGVTGFGFLALGVMIFGQWKPLRIFGAAMFFGLFRAIANMSDTLFPTLVMSGFTTNIFNMLPFIASMIILALTSKSSRQPKAEGIPYDKGLR